MKARSGFKSLIIIIIILSVLYSAHRIIGNIHRVELANCIKCNDVESHINKSAIEYIVRQYDGWDHPVVIDAISFAESIQANNIFKAKGRYSEKKKCLSENSIRKYAGYYESLIPNNLKRRVAAYRKRLLFKNSIVFGNWSGEWSYDSYVDYICKWAWRDEYYIISCTDFVVPWASKYNYEGLSNFTPYKRYLSFENVKVDYSRKEYIIAEIPLLNELSLLILYPQVVNYQQIFSIHELTSVIDMYDVNRETERKKLYLPLVECTGRNVFETLDDPSHELYNTCCVGFVSKRYDQLREGVLLKEECMDGIVVDSDYTYIIMDVKRRLILFIGAFF